MVQFYDPIDIGGEIGAGLGKGIGDQLQRSAAASQVGKTLDSLRDAYAGGKADVFSLLSGATQAGMLLPPEQAAAFQKSLPLLLSEMERQRTLKGLDRDDIEKNRGVIEPSAGQQTTTETARPTPSAQQIAEEPAAKELTGVDRVLGDIEQDIATVQDTAALREMRREPFRYSNRQFQERVAEVKALKRMDDNEATQFVQNEESRINQRRNDVLQKRIADVEDENDLDARLQSQLATVLQADEKSGLPGAGLPGEAQQAFRMRARELKVVDPNLTNDQIATRVSQEANQFVKSRNALQGSADYNIPWAMGVGGSAVAGVFENYDKYVKNMTQKGQAYRDLGLGELLYEDLRNKGLSDEFAALNAYPPNRELNTSLQKIPDVPNVEKVNAKSMNKLSQQATDRLVEALDNFTDKDSLLAVKMIMHQKGYPEDVLIDALGEKYGDDLSGLGTRNAQRESTMLAEKMQPSLAEIAIGSSGSVKTMLNQFKRLVSGGRSER